ncbi:fimbrial biogenesis outer membrane usher protein [Myxococcaceae bacterium JPH2]|nr:fimbrial biogenesis outer membrane usher protein [Myxococcaceae bacterium JPH2]
MSRAMSARRSWGHLGWACAASLLVMGLEARALPTPEARVAPQEPIVAELTLNDIPRGEVFPLLRDEDVWLPLSTLQECDVDMGKLGGRTEVVAGQGYVSLRSLAPDTTFQFDARAATLQVRLPATAFRPTRIDLALEPPRGYGVRGDPSGFLNYAARTRNTWLTLFGEVGASVGRGLFTTQAQWHPGREPLRGLTQLTVDFPEVMVRAIAGESTGYGGALGGGAVVAGLHVLRSFELNPYFVRNPVQDFAGDVSTPSSLEVYVNNQLVRRTDLPPGPFRLENVTVPRGEGSTRYVVRDAFGRAREVRSSYSLGEQLLAPGVVDYHLSVGAERQSLATRSFDFGSPLLLGSFRVGTTPWLTPGVRLEVSPDRLSTGLMQTAQLPVGAMELAEAVSRSEGQTGVAAGVAYALQGQWMGGSFFTRAMSAHYAHTNLAPADDHPRLETGGGFFLSLGNRVNVGGQLAVTHWRDRGWTTWLGATTSARVTDLATLSFTASRGQEQSGVAALEGTVFLSAILDARTSASVGYGRAVGGDTASVDVSRGVPLEGGWGFQVQGQTGRAEQARGRVDYEGDVGRATAGMEWAAGNLVGLAEVSGGVVAIGGRVRATRVVDQGFALVRVTGVEGIGVRLNNHVIGRTDPAGEYVVTRLQAYSPNRLSLSDEELPLEMQVPTTEAMVVPWRRGGVVLDFRARVLRALRGRLVLVTGEESRAPAYGELRVEAGGERWSSPVGAKGEFELSGVPPGRYPATVVFSGGQCVATLDVPAVSGRVVDVGRVRCVNE